MTVSGTLLILSGFFGINLAGGAVKQGETEDRDGQLVGGVHKSKRSDDEAGVEEHQGLLRQGRVTEDGAGAQGGL